MPMKKVSRVLDIKKTNQIRNSLTGFNRSTWSPAKNMQPPPPGTSHLILGDSLVRALLNLRNSWITTVIAFEGATVAHFYRMVEQMNPGKIVDPYEAKLCQTVYCNRIPQQGRSLCSSFVLYFPLIVPKNFSQF